MKPRIRVHTRQTPRSHLGYDALSLVAQLTNGTARIYTQSILAAELDLPEIRGFIRDLMGMAAFLADQQTGSPPEPPNGSRLEFTDRTDLYAAYRDDQASREAGYPAGESWCLYGHTVPMSWAQMVAEFGATTLAEATLLVPEVPNGAK